MSKNNLPQELKGFGDIFDSLARSHGPYPIFQDFLDLSINAWSLNYGLDLVSILNKYSERERSLFGQLIHETIRILDRMVVNDNDLYDVLGTFYEANSLTNKHFAQFFTPLEVCRLMAQLTAPKRSDAFHDCCSGSGRFSLAANSVSPGMFHTLVDIDHTCARMSALNLMYHGIHGIVICDNALFAGTSFKGAFIVNRWLNHSGVPQIEFVADANIAYDYVADRLPSPKAGQRNPAPRHSPIQEIANNIMENSSNQLKLF